MRIRLYSAALLILLTGLQSESGMITTNHYRLATSVSAPLDGTYYDDHQILTRTPGAHGTLLDLSAYAWSHRVGINAFMVIDHLLIFVPDTTFQKNGTTYRRQDLVAFNPLTSTFSKYFDGAAAGVPVRAGIDAITPADDPEAFYFSLDVAASLPGVGAVRQHDILHWNGSDTFSIFISGDSLELPASANINALHLDPDDTMYFSLDKPWGSGVDRDVWRISDLQDPFAKLYTFPLLNTPGVDVVALDFPRDSDGDGLTDFEEITGLNEPSSVLPGTTVLLDPGGNVTDPFNPDTDGDGFTDAEEALAGTDPNDEDDYLRFLAISALSPSETVVTWRSEVGREYGLYAVDEDEGGLIDQDWSWLINQSGQSGHTSYTNLTFGTDRIYQIRLLLD